MSDTTEGGFLGTQRLGERRGRDREDSGCHCDGDLSTTGPPQSERTTAHTHERTILEDVWKAG